MFLYCFVQNIYQNVYRTSWNYEPSYTWTNMTWQYVVFLFIKRLKMYSFKIFCGLIDFASQLII